MFLVLPPLSENILLTPGASVYIEYCHIVRQYVQREGERERENLPTLPSHITSISISMFSPSHCPTQYQLPGASQMRFAGSATQALDSCDTFSTWRVEPSLGTAGRKEEGRLKVKVKEEEEEERESSIYIYIYIYIYYI